jgi:hypothetical protein
MLKGLGRLARQNTVALLALFLALGGTSAFAAATLINGSQIKPHTIAKNRLTNKAIKQLKGNRGPQGLQGPKGTTGAQGVQGIQGPPGPFPDPLSPGHTLRGNYSTGAGNGNGVTISGVSFGFRLSAAPTVHFITVGTTPPAQCPGTVTDPQASAGHLCIYEGTQINVTAFRGECDPEQSGCIIGAGNREGFAVFAQASTVGNPMYTFGS